VKISPSKGGKLHPLLKVVLITRKSGFKSGSQWHTFRMEIVNHLMEK